MDIEELTARWLSVIEKARKPKVESDWIWRTGAFAGQFADAFIQNTNLEGGDVPSTLQLLINITKPLFEDEILRKCHLPLLTHSNIESLHQLYYDLNNAVHFGKELAKIRNKIATFASFLEFWVEKVNNLEVGERLIINGGWLVATKSDESLYTIQ